VKLALLLRIGNKLTANDIGREIGNAIIAHLRNEEFGVREILQETRSYGFTIAKRAV
jgi:hypothetical protein